MVLPPRMKYTGYNETPTTEGITMKKADKIALAYILSPLVLAGISLAKSYAYHRKSQAARQLEIDAHNYAAMIVTKMFLNDELESKEQLEQEWQFAYMNYRAHH